MSFRKRNIVLPNNSQKTPIPQPINAGIEGQLPLREVHSPITTSPPKAVQPSPGVRPSPIDGRATISTGASTLDKLLAGHAGLPLGSSLLLEESGTTDFSGALLRYFAAEGVVQGHQVHVVGVGEQWGRELPGLAGVADGNPDADISRPNFPSDRGLSDDGSLNSTTSQAAFCHIFDLAKRLEYPAGSGITYIPTVVNASSSSPFHGILEGIATQLRSDHTGRIHRVVIPNLLSPALYPPHACDPTNLLPFFHGLRSLLRQFSTQLSVIMTLTLDLYPRSTGLVRWAELLNDGVLELTPFPHLMDSLSTSTATSGGANTHEQPPQGLLHVHRLPIFHEKGGGGRPNDGEGDLAFTVTRRKFTIKPFSLPPMDGDTDAQQGGATAVGEGGNTSNTKINIDF
ncbi:paxneb superfamily protein [Xylona heveae TC161]|uniref:Elongator complex protein 4 n=1 Tax=Xylona heveae (strain CBS 132557 / TC161) TaxID=1328760 RepID=A0A165H8W2_XYLHT|nr:paxneb superfamily protein [Xylona heveae TC161]KZF23146.1 paxneb superfamily protein [Xylona heveae TC161]